MKRGFAGLSTWVIQRVGAVSMLVLVPYLLWTLTMRPAATYAEWRMWVAQPGTSVALGIFFAALLSHMWVGLRDVLLDYAKPASVRNGGLLALALSLALIAYLLAATLFHAWA